MLSCCRIYATARNVRVSLVAGSHASINEQVAESAELAGFHVHSITCRTALQVTCDLVEVIIAGRIALHHRELRTAWMASQTAFMQML